MLTVLLSDWRCLLVSGIESHELIRHKEYLKYQSQRRAYINRYQILQLLNMTQDNGADMRVWI